MKSWKNKDGFSQEELYVEINALLKKADSRVDLKTIIERVNEEDVHPIYFIMKRSNKEVIKFDFKIDKDRVDYILDDGKSYRSSKISNLHKNIVIGE